MDNKCNLNDTDMVKFEHQNIYTELFIKNFYDMIFHFDQQLILIACSDACSPLLRNAESTGYKNIPLKDIFSPDMDGEWIENIYQQNNQALLTLSHRHFDDTITFNGKNHMHTRVSISPVSDESGKCLGTIMTVNDITELVEARRHAEDAAHSKSSFLANMSHEIRTPMNAVKGLSELLALTELNNLQRSYVKNIISSANSLLGILNDVLDFSKIDANKIDFIEGPYDLATLITGVCNVVSMRADDKNLLFIVNASPDLPSTLHGDDVRIKQVLTNLLSNAVKYTNEGYIRLKVNTQVQDGSSWICFSVEDSGIGIKTEDIPLLFDAFSRADLVTNRKISGTGLGLAISKQLAIAMGGDIKVESEYGKGSTFTFRIPKKIVDPLPIANIDDPKSRYILLLGSGHRIQNIAAMLKGFDISFTQTDTPDSIDESGLNIYTHCISDENFPEHTIRFLYDRMPDCLFAAVKNIRHAMSVSDFQDTIIYIPVFITELSNFLNRNKHDSKNASSPDIINEELTVRNASLLVVDDNEINLIVGGDILRSFGADIVCAESGETALQLCEEQKFDIIFMDHMMPGKDGIQTTIEIRKNKGLNSDTPIVALTANVVNDMKNVYLKNGMDDFISKPIEFSDIRRVLTKWLPKEKILTGYTATVSDTEESGSGLMTPEDLIAAFDNFGLYSSDVMREMNGDFYGYIARMEEAGKVLNPLVSNLKSDVSEKRWDDFSHNCHELRNLLYGIGARDCAARARKLAIAGQERNTDYIFNDFFSLMGNMYMLDKKLIVIVPFARGKDRNDLPLGSSQFLHGCLEKMGRALAENNAVEAMVQLENTASFSLDMTLDMALKEIKADIEKCDFHSAIEHFTAIFKVYTEQLSNC